MVHEKDEQTEKFRSTIDGGQLKAKKYIFI